MTIVDLWLFIIFSLFKNTIQFVQRKFFYPYFFFHKINKKEYFLLFFIFMTIHPFLILAFLFVYTTHLSNKRIYYLLFYLDLYRKFPWRWAFYFTYFFFVYIQNCTISHSENKTTDISLVLKFITIPHLWIVRGATGSALVTLILHHMISDSSFSK